MTNKIILTKNAIKQINSLKAKEKNESLMLRVTVSSGGCSGFQYEFELTDIKKDNDLIFTQESASLITDQISFSFLENAEIDYKNDLIGSSFVINNPQASSSCGCGTSFSV